MDLISVIVGVVNKKFLQGLYRKRRGPKGYGHARIIRLLVYAHSKQFYDDKAICRHLGNNPSVARKLGFRQVPDRRTVGKWKKKYGVFLTQAIKLLGDYFLAQTAPPLSVLDSGPLEDYRDKDSRSGKCSKGWFKGFKLHICCDDKRVPLRAIFTTGNVHDSKPAPQLLVGVPCILGDSAYDAEKLRKQAREMNAALITDENPRRRKKRTRKRPWILKKWRYVVEQTISLLKDQTMQHLWTKVKGFARKQIFALSAVILVQALAIYSFKKGRFNINIKEVIQ